MPAHKVAVVDYKLQQQQNFYKCCKTILSEMLKDVYKGGS